MLLTMESKTAAHQKLEQLIQQGRTQAGSVIDYVMNNQPADRLQHGSSLSFDAADGQGVHVAFEDTDAGSIRLKLHRHAVQQMAQTTDLPIRFIDGLLATPDRWAKELLAHNLSTIFSNRFRKQRYLLRSVQGEVRGFLSDRYRRLDSRPVIEAFAAEVERKGALPYAGYVTDTKIAIQAIMPKVYELVPGELVAYGLSLENSDFGNGALSIRAYLLRIRCSNLAITQEEMRQVHLGRRLDDSTFYSQATYELDAATTVSVVIHDEEQIPIEYKTVGVAINGTHWNAILDAVPDDLKRALKGSVKDSTPDNDAIKRAAARNEPVPGAEVKRGHHLRVV